MTTKKLTTLPQLRTLVETARSKGQKAVWTNGCFDIMHAGHILYLEKARALGDLLIVGLNSDASVRLLKGPSRPIVPEDQRAIVMGALSCVDYVIVFDEQSPLRLLEILKPEVFAKGGDYTLDTLDQKERRMVESYGGNIALLPGVPGMSTSNLIEKILQSHRS
jgi:rfaE bifunctional protein nucleotidyltransferase chain/domain